MKNISKKALKIVGWYMLVSFIWIFFSDKFLYTMTQDIEHYNVFQTYKGVFFIIITSILLYLLIKRSHLEIETLNSRLEESLIVLKNSHNELEKVAYVDYLTKLNTRRFMMEKCEVLFESAKRSETFLTMVMIDIDYFKKYNDRYGHGDGDKILSVLGELIRKNFKRKTDAVSRYGGEEFLVALPQTDLLSAIYLVEKFQKKLTSFHLQHEDSPFGEITVSVGISSCKVLKHETLDSLLRKADKELYRAKDSGRNRYSFSKNTDKESFLNCDLNQINIK